MKPKQAIASTTRVKMNGHLLPTISDRKPTGTIVDETITPIKKQAPRNPILAFDSQRIGWSVWFCQLSMYCESFSSGWYSSLDSPYSQMYCLLQSCHSPVSLSRHVKCCGAIFMKGSPKIKNPAELRAIRKTKMITCWNIVLRQVCRFLGPMVLLMAPS